jgi:hypothetical protein
MIEYDLIMHECPKVNIILKIIYRGKFEYPAHRQRERA